MKYIAKFILWVWGWKIVAGMPADIKKCVVVMAPHTSMWDFVLGRLAWFVLGLKVKFLIKKEMFFFPLGVWFCPLSIPDKYLHLLSM